MQSRVKDKMVLLGVGDCMFMALASLCALAVGHRGAFSYQLVNQYTVPILTLILPVLIVFFIIDAYSPHRTPLSFMRQTMIIVLGLLLSAVITTFMFFFFRETVPRAVFILFYLFSAVMIVGLRYLFISIASPQIWKLLIIGECERTKIIDDIVRPRKHLHTHIVGLLSDNPDSYDRPDCPCLGNVSELLLVITQQKIDQVIVATESINNDLARMLVECMQMKVKVSNYFHVIEDVTGKIPVNFLDDNWFILELSNKSKRYFWYVKRFCDIVIALLGLFLAFPLFLLAAFLIKLDSHGPVFYKQLRTGRHNKPFWAWKLRTMVDGADKNNVHWTLDNDNRITRVGKWLRKLRFDEVPQLINILKGEMSLIGPRPEAISLVEKYTKAIPYYLERHMVSPGITGWAQINYRYGNSIEDTHQKLMFDLFYIKNRSALLDLIIFLRTIRTVLTGKGAM